MFVQVGLQVSFMLIHYTQLSDLGKSFRFSVVYNASELRVTVNCVIKNERVHYDVFTSPHVCIYQIT